MKMVKGSVKWFNDTKGFGFIEIISGEHSGRDIFVHACDVEGRPLRDDDQVEFDIEEDERSNGKKRAGHVTGGTGREGDAPRTDDRPRGGREGGGGGGVSFKPGDWHCEECKALNFASRERCFKCQAHPSSGGRAARGRGDSRARPRGRERVDSRARRNSRSRGRGRGGNGGGGGRR